MASLKNIKLKILSVKKTSTVTKAMEAVSAVKMRKAQERALSSRLYAASALSILQRVSGSADMARHSLMREGTGKTAVIIITSDKGLAGSLNSAVIRKAEQLIADKGLQKEQVIMFGMGRRGADFFANRGYDMREKHENISDAASESDVLAITRTLLAAHATGEISEAHVVYTNFLSTFEQEAIARQIVPISQKMVTEIIAGIRPAKGKYAPSSADATPAKPAPYTVEPEVDTVLGVLLPKLINIAVFHGLLESKASEHSARMVAMKNATDNAKEKVKEYTRTFNKVRQAAITREISEITSGIEAMR